MEHFKFPVLFFFIGCLFKIKRNKPATVDTCDQITEAFDPHPYTVLRPPTAVFTYDDQDRLYRSEFHSVSFTLIQQFRAFLS